MGKGAFIELLGWKVAAIYLITGLLIAMVAGWIIGRLKLEHWIEDWVQKMRAGEAVVGTGILFTGYLFNLVI